MKKRQKPSSNILKHKGLSDFEKSVLIAVADIPAGEVRTYKYIASSVGRPYAARAVGNALNKNPYIGIIPCHRVIRSDGSIGGFAKGMAAKKKLLKEEGVDCRKYR